MCTLENRLNVQKNLEYLETVQLRMFGGLWVYT